MNVNTLNISLVPFISIGQNQSLANDGVTTYLGATVGFNDSFQAGTVPIITNNPNDTFRIIMLVPAFEA